jgi:hypothetical protein
VDENDLERKSGANNLFGLDGDLRKIGDGRFSLLISTMVGEGAPAQGSSRTRRLGAPLASGESAFQPPLMDCAAGCASREWFLRDHHASGSLRSRREDGPR